MNVFLVLLFFMFCQQANAMSYEMCNKVALEMNKQTPLQIDSYTSLKTTLCTRGSGVKPILNYHNITNLTYVDLQATTNYQKHSWCTETTQRRLLNEVDAKYSYFNAAGKFMGSTYITSSMCR